jgi:signal transduction histidine kinase/CheY-like chemotaxis protein
MISELWIVLARSPARAKGIMRVLNAAGYRAAKCANPRQLITHLMTEPQTVRLGKIPRRATFSIKSLQSMILRATQAVAVQSADAALAARSREEALEAQVRQLTQSHEDAQRALRAKDELLAALAHELRNPLAALFAAAEILRVSAAERGPEQRAHAIISRQVLQMKRLVDDLTDVARLTRMRLEVKKVSCRLSYIVDSALEGTRALMMARSHTLSVDLPPVDIQLWADPARLIQVLSNLLTNAAKYTQPQGKIALEAQLVDSHVMLTVRDNGRGIPATSLQTIFNMFIQLESLEEGSAGGLGIGLALAKALVELHQGTLEAYSAGVGHGSEFVVRIPYVAPPTEVVVNISHASRDTLPVNSRRQVLIVDDNQDAAESLAHLLRLSGHEVLIASSAEQGLRLAECHMIDSAILDLGMPTMSGLTMAQQLRERESGRRAIQLIAVTGYDQPADRQAAREAGFNHYLPKPVDLQELLDLIASAGQGRQQEN